jgi:hypothetical protein
MIDSSEEGHSRQGTDPFSLVSGIATSRARDRIAIGGADALASFRLM